MGSSGSKPYCGGGASSSSSSSGGRGGISKGRRVFQSACLGSPSGSGEADVDEQIRDHRRSKECGRNCSRGSRKKGECDEVKSDCYGKVKEAQSDDGLSSISSGCPIDEWHQARITNSASGTGSSSARASSTRLMSGPGRILSRFSFVPGNVSFRLGRASSLGSSRPYPVPPTGLAMLNHEDDIEMHQASARYDTENRSALRFHIPESNCLDDVTRTSTLSSSHGEAGDNNCAGVAVDVNLHSPRIFHEVDGIQTRLPDRRIGAREPVERNARFSRTLSVGRLRDRVLRRSSLSEQPFCPLQQQREVRNAPQDTDSQALRDVAVLAETSSMSGQTTSSTSGFLVDIQGHEVEASRSRDHRYHDLLEHRSNFLERRRQVRSQVRALQRLGSRFENLSGHDRSCILSGQHRTGRCTCRMSNRDSNSNDDTNASASISRIVMLAEALFEVLDEIHQQSVVLSSRPSVSSIGSVPAPHEVVESLHVKVYTKSFKLLSDETTQCYICLVEYEDGDSLRVLPCNHEFHRVCIDKWLKEIHRVCPLCRGDICRSDSLPAED